MAWCHQASSHYLSQCWPRSLSHYDVTRPQRVKTTQRLRIPWHHKWSYRNIALCRIRLIFVKNLIRLHKLHLCTPWRFAFCRGAHNILAKLGYADALAPYIARSPAGMILTYKINSLRCLSVKWVINNSDNIIACSMPSHFLNQCWLTVNWTVGNKIPWNFNQHSNFFIEENEFWSVVFKITPILSQPKCVNMFLSSLLSDSYMHQ